MLLFFFASFRIGMTIARSTGNIVDLVCYGQDKMACHLHLIFFTWDAVIWCHHTVVWQSYCRKLTFRLVNWFYSRRNDRE